MDSIMNFNGRIFSDSIKNVIIKIFNSLDTSDINNSENSNLVINKILENPNDERLFNETVEYLKQHKEIKEKEISLSNNNSLTISIE
ncbi:hypothetical protein [Flavobacterium sp. CF136]|uniref:hypothetical protein n=1 Tax=Flavobacterium sp. (strain CF136) TaxID=1144313 RepID=UPI0002716C1B|nr:hypothetical protein [Flavobacterium sp. CF136]EJL59280.1 hypothetical protein PMI10_04245 [Flavobacterium sp. CF136]